MSEVCIIALNKPFKMDSIQNMYHYLYTTINEKKDHNNATIKVWAKNIYAHCEQR